jgi:predicted Zn-dependent protease with MMP-like domain
MPHTPDQQDLFDRHLETAMRTVPDAFREMLDAVTIIVLDRPTPEMLDELRRDGLLDNEDGTESDGSDLCGLHTGTPLTDRSIDDPAHVSLPDQIHLFREGIINLVKEDFGLDWGDDGFEAELAEEIRITLLHEVGHHFGLDEDDLERLGYA